MGYFRDTFKGISWIGSLRVSTRLLAFLKIAILARILLPEQFGLFGIASLALAFLEILTETGINVFLVQSKINLKKYINTAWVIAIFRGILISSVIVLASSLITSFFKSPGSYSLLLLISLVPLIRGFLNPAIIKFQKELEFNKEFFFRFFVFSCDAFFAVLITLIIRSASGLVWGLIAGGLLEVLLSFIVVKPIPKFVIEKAQVRKILGRGKWVTAAGIFNYLFRQGDDIVVGRLLNVTALGTYQIAYKLSTLPITEVSEVFGKVTFPVYVKISDDIIRLKRAFVRTTLTISALVIPIGLILFFFSKEIVLIVLGGNWLAVVPALKVLSIFGMVRAISGSSSALFLAIKKQEYVMVVTLVSILGLAISIVPLVVKFGIVGAGLSALIGSITALPIIIFYLARVFGDLK